MPVSLKKFNCAKCDWLIKRKGRWYDGDWKEASRFMVVVNRFFPTFRRLRRFLVRRNWMNLSTVPEKLINVYRFVDAGKQSSLPKGFSPQRGTITTTLCRKRALSVFAMLYVFKILIRAALTRNTTATLSILPFSFVFHRCLTSSSYVTHVENTVIRLTWKRG